MKKFKHIKLFESFVNEELSPELKKRTYDEMMKIANDPNVIDSLKRRNQADNVQSSLTPAVEKLKNELENHLRKVLGDDPISTKSVYKVQVYDYGLENEKDNYVRLTLFVENSPITAILINKDKYEKMRYTSMGQLDYKLYSDRAFVNTLKKLIVQIQKDEIPGDEQVPAQPESITPEGEI